MAGRNRDREAGIRLVTVGPGTGPKLGGRYRAITVVRVDV